jgi:predicted heme/steroid binding protein
MIISDDRKSSIFSIQHDSNWGGGLHQKVHDAGEASLCTQIFAVLGYHFLE